MPAAKIAVPTTMPQAIRMPLIRTAQETLLTFSTVPFPGFPTPNRIHADTLNPDCISLAKVENGDDRQDDTGAAHRDLTCSAHSEGTRLAMWFGRGVTRSARSLSRSSQEPAGELRGVG